MGTKTFDCAFIGYAQNSVAYRSLCLSDDSICESRNVKFFKNVFPMRKNAYDIASSSNASSLSLFMPSSFDTVNDNVHEPMRSQR